MALTKDGTEIESEHFVTVKKGRKGSGFWEPYCVHWGKRRCYKPEFEQWQIFQLI
ncbi:hypothetical protein [Chroococcidiopsis sp. CCMEE 29]|uniref:hypothetical protein n=1 Tax=Chroococcidiopsis sp. CCMEE 29 TaxID=155894 RepID=UPI0020216CB0|nr:hypothetical protein [Chroococcidiopsis sp. CCMEE 29]